VVPVGGKNEFDINYLTDNIIVCSHPKVGKGEAQLRSFLETFHRQQCKIYNLCAEKDLLYSAQTFECPVEVFPAVDYEPFPFPQIILLCKNIHSWIQVNPSHVVVLHSKRGRSRTAVAACSYLLYCRFGDFKRFPSYQDRAAAAFRYFVQRRCPDGNCYLSPSQERYIEYFARYCLQEEGEPGFASPMKMSSSMVSSSPGDVGER